MTMGEAAGSREHVCVCFADTLSCRGETEKGGKGRRRRERRTRLFPLFFFFSFSLSLCLSAPSSHCGEGMTNSGSHSNETTIPLATIAGEKRARKRERRNFHFSLSAFLSSSAPLLSAPCSNSAQTSTVVPALHPSCSSWRARPSFPFPLPPPSPHLAPLVLVLLLAPAFQVAPAFSLARASAPALPPARRSLPSTACRASATRRCLTTTFRAHFSHLVPCLLPCLSPVTFAVVAGWFVAISAATSGGSSEPKAAPEK